MQGGLEPIVALGGEDLGPASVLSRTDGQGEDFAGRGVAEVNSMSRAPKNRSVFQVADLSANPPSIPVISVFSQLSSLRFRPKMKGKVGRHFVASVDFPCPAKKNLSTILDFSTILAYL